MFMSDADCCFYEHEFQLQKASFDVINFTTFSISNVNDGSLIALII